MLQIGTIILSALVKAYEMFKNVSDDGIFEVFVWRAMIGLCITEPVYVFETDHIPAIKAQFVGS